VQTITNSSRLKIKTNLRRL